MERDVVRARARTVLDRDGQAWTVREFVSEIDGRVDRSLLFDNGWAIRRVRDYPSTWPALTDDELVRISHRR